MNYYLTDHARKRIAERWKDDRKLNPYRLAKDAWLTGRMMDDRETKVFFSKWADKAFDYMPEVRVFEGIEFLFQTTSQGDVRLVTMLENHHEWNDRKARERRNGNG